MIPGIGGAPRGRGGTLDPRMEPMSRVRETYAICLLETLLNAAQAQRVLLKEIRVEAFGTRKELIDTGAQPPTGSLRLSCVAFMDMQRAACRRSVLTKKR